MIEYDVIIIGAGPSGLALAKEIEDVRLLLIDAKKKPFKNIACAEWVPALSHFTPFKVAETSFMELIVNDTRRTVKAPGYIIDREKLQKSMLESLKCTIHLGERVVKVDKNTVKTNCGTYKAEWIVGAYGPWGPMNEKENKHNFLPAINVRVTLKRNLKKTLIYFSEEILHGYAWCFPRKDEANCGVGARSRNLKSLLLKWLTVLKKQGIIEDVRYREAHTGLIPLSVLRKSLHSNHILIGDAGGFADPLTGAGIQNAFESAHMASSLIKGRINKEEYERLLQSSYLAKYLKRRKKRRDLMEKKWNDLKEAIEKSWISFYRE